MVIHTSAQMLPPMKSFMVKPRKSTHPISSSTVLHIRASHLPLTLFYNFLLRNSLSLLP